MRLPRMTPRRWMIAVAVVGLAMGAIVYAVRLEQLRAYYHYRAFNIRQSEQLFRYPTHRGEVPEPAAAERLSRLAEKYEYAARYPWLPVEPDPTPWLPVEPDPTPPQP